MNEREAIKVGSWSPRNIAGGYWGTTTLAVCRRAKVSHGSLLHHFGTREKLLGAALGVLYARLRQQVVAGLEALPQGSRRVDAVVDLMWSAFGAPEFKAILELWLAAANEPDVGWVVWPEAAAFERDAPEDGRGRGDANARARSSGADRTRGFRAACRMKRLLVGLGAGYSLGHVGNGVGHEGFGDGVAQVNGPTEGRMRGT
jgi:AcrR family transcriptional regulator